MNSLCAIVFLAFLPYLQARPSVFQDGAEFLEDFTGLEGLAILAGFLLLTAAGACVCCRKTKSGFSEFRGSTQLSEIPGQTGEVTLFPPPSLSLSREDVDVSFEALPEPLQHSKPIVNSYRSKDVGEWINEGHGLFPRSNIQYLREIGRGWFGQVVEAEVKDPSGGGRGGTRCVVKILRPEADGEQHARFLSSVRPLVCMEPHPNVVKVLGCCLETAPLLVLMQHCANGDLRQFLLAYGIAGQDKGRTPPLPENVLLRMAWEACEGLRHWHKSGFTHPDVAARSFLVTGDMSIVIGDYGTHSLSYQDDFLNPDGEHLIPLRWLPPECLSSLPELNVTVVGNVWSFGVVLWEILSLGSRPYAALTDEQVVQQVLREKRTVLNPPDLNYQQAQALYRLMVQCWEVEAHLRPSMDEISCRLAAVASGVNRDVERDLERAFDSRWNAARPNASGRSDPENGSSPSASLNNLHGSLDSEQDLNEESNLSEAAHADASSHTDRESESTFSAKVSAALRSLDEALAAAGGSIIDESSHLPEPEFRLDGSRVERRQDGDESCASNSSSASSSLFSSRSWQDEVHGSHLTALVREKSRSVQDLMVLTHVEPLSDVEFASRALPASREASATPQIYVTSPSLIEENLSRPGTSHAESDVPLLDSTDANAKNELLDTGSFMNLNRNRLTSTPRDDTNLSAMESSFRDQQANKSAEYSPFSPESLDATQFTNRTGGDQQADEAETPDNSSVIIMGPSEELGLLCYQSITTTRPDGEPVVQQLAEEEVPVAREDGGALQVNLDHWNQYLDAAYVQRVGFEGPLEASGDGPQFLRDSGIARPSFSGSVDILGSTFDQSRDSLSLVAQLWNEQLAAALAMEDPMMVQDETDPPNSSEANASGISDSSSPTKTSREQTYYSYDKIDEDIRAGVPRQDPPPLPVDVRHDLSTIREERESVSSTEAGLSSPSKEDPTGAELLAQLQLKNRIQRQVSPSSSDDSAEEDVEEDDEEVLVVDLEGKRAILVEGQSPTLKAAMAAHDYDAIFRVPQPAPHVMLNSNVSRENGAENEDGGESTRFREDPSSDESDDDWPRRPADTDDEEEAEDEENEGEEDEDESDEEAESDGIEQTNFVWQASYPSTSKLNQSLSMEVIEEECEDEEREELEVEEEDQNEFVPSTWRSDLTPTRPALKSPENGSWSRKNRSVSFTGARSRRVYRYPGEEEEEEEARKEESVPSRRQWTAPAKSSDQTPYAHFADWEFAVEDEDRQDSSADGSPPKEALKPRVPTRPGANSLPSNILYRLSDIDHEDEDSDLVPTTGSPADGGNATYFRDSWTPVQPLTQFQTDQYFPHWALTDQADATNGNGDVEDQFNGAVGTLRHTRDSLRLELPQSESEA